MKHLLSKTFINGAWPPWKKKKPEPPPPPPPAKLEPPKLGNYQIYSSYSNIEVVDLLSDGPIHGLTNSYGRDLQTNEIFQGIYFDNTPIAISTQKDENSNEVFNVNTSISNKLKDFASAVSQNITANRSSSFFSQFYKVYYGEGGWTTKRSDGCVANDWTNFDGNISDLSENKNIAIISTSQFGKKVPYNTRGARTTSIINIRAEYAAPNFKDWQNAYTPNAKFLYKDNFDQQIHWWNNTENQANSILTLAKNGFNKILTENKNLNIYEKQIIQEKLAKFDEIKKDLHNEKWDDEKAKDPLLTALGLYRAGNPMVTAHSKNILYIIKASDTFDRKSFTNIGIKNGEDATCIDSNNKLKKFSFYFKNVQPSLINIACYDFIIPEIDKNDQFTGRVYGFYAFYIPCETSEKMPKFPTYGKEWFRNQYTPVRIHKSIIPQRVINAFNKSDISLRFSFISNGDEPNNYKYNYSNITSEIKKGFPNQKPLSLFNKIYIDREYRSKLIGPFRANGQVRRFKEKSGMLIPGSNKLTEAELIGGIPRLYYNAANSDITEGSRDTERQGPGDYSNGKSIFDEEAISVTHVIDNQETDSIIISLQINELKDTLTKQMDIDGSAGTKNYSDEKIDDYNNYKDPEKRANIGTDLPTVVTIRIETGKIKNENFYEKKSYDYTIYGYIPSPTIIDFGSPANNLTNYNFIAKPKNKNFDDPFELPKLLTSENPSIVKRYVRVYKISTETNSVLIRKEIFLAKITEIINSKFSYPYCALIGNKFDARAISSIPLRSYDCRLKTVKIPANYKIIKEGYDVRYQNSKKDYESGDLQLIYDGDWNGDFTIGWTDNPAWILYDMLTSKRYGLGQYLQESQINVWELYKIGRYCDAVDDNGYFIGVPDGRGGLEPRFSCNIMFSQATKIFDAINIVANLFRGSVFFSNSEVNFVDDRPREPIALFTNSNVKDAAFNYVSNKKDEIFNIVEVAYLDKNDNFKTKIEYAEDPEDIRNRGPQKTVINTVGVTSKSMARRIGQHAIWQTTKENQGVEFVAGLESLLCKPGDLIIVEDDLKNRKINYGRILDIDINNRQLRLDNPYDENNFNGYIEVYTPTGETTKEELTALSKIDRSRYPSFKVTSVFKSDSHKSLTGEYVFSKYVGTKAFYTGQNQHAKTFCYYDEDLDGWVFSTGLAFQKNNTYDKILSNVTTNTSIKNITGLFTYNVNSQRPIGKELIKGQALSNKFLFPDKGFSDGGIFDNEINTQGVRQISKYQISSVITNILDGSIVTLNEDNFNLNLLQFVQPGSPYRCQLKDTENQIYKVISVREESQNQYRIVGTKYDTGKWLYIENDTFIENPQQVFYSKTFNQVLESLPAPHSLYLDSFLETSSSFSLTGSFKVTKGNRFRIKLENKAVGFYFENEIDTTSFNIRNINDLGKYELTVQNISTNGKSIDSYPSQIQKFIGYQKTDLSDYDRPFIQNFTII